MPSRFSILLRWINFYPPLLGAGIHSHRVDENTTRVEMKLSPLNRNIYGTHFGGSLYAMCDPWFVLILKRALGAGYTIWDKAASIQFMKPGLGRVRAEFHIPPEVIADLRYKADLGEVLEPSFSVDVVDERDQVVAHVDKLLHIRKK